MDLPKVFDSYSRRQQSVGDEGVFSYEVGGTLRNKIFQLCEQRYRQPTAGIGPNVFARFWKEIHSILRMRHGRQQLSEGVHSVVAVDAQRFAILDSIGFLNRCSDAEFLDFIEDIFALGLTMQETAGNPNAFIRQINQVFQSERSGYELTELVEAVDQGVAVNGMPYRHAKVISVPRIIRMDNDVVHTQAIMPALTLLGDPRFAEANKEFMEALVAYKDNKLGRCLAMCGTAFESVMKVLIETKNWKPYSKSDGAANLIETVLKNTALDGFFKKPLTLIAMIRNELSESHGAGSKPKDVDPEVARYAINATASAILLLVEKAKL